MHKVTEQIAMLQERLYQSEEREEMRGGATVVPRAIPGRGSIVAHHPLQLCCLRSTQGERRGDWEVNLLLRSAARGRFAAHPRRVGGSAGGRGAQRAEE